MTEKEKDAYLVFPVDSYFDHIMALAVVEAEKEIARFNLGLCPICEHPLDWVYCRNHGDMAIHAIRNIRFRNRYKDGPIDQLVRGVDL